MLACTSFHPAGYEQYGKRCLEGLSEFFPGKIVAYVEEETPFKHPKVEIRDFFQIQGAKQYLERIKRVAGADGWGSGGYSYEWDASKFCRKVFAQDAVFDESDAVFWFDADSYLLKPVPEEFLRDLLTGVPFCFLGRKNYTETGFLGFNTHHPKFSEFRGQYLAQFTTGKIFSNSKGWHDCIAFDEARKGIKGNDLTQGEAMGHVLLKSCLAPYMDHCKGPKRKAHGYSPGHPVTDPSRL